MRLLLIDNFDSFTFNLVQAFLALGAAVEVVRRDAGDARALLARRPDGLVLSPGPGRPEDAGVCLSLLRALPDAAPALPLLGVCLGHQALAQVHGARIVRAAQPIHGKVWPIVATDAADADPLWRGLPRPLLATRYHSLVADPQTLPADLVVTARTPEGEVMALRHRARPLWGVQFHPESVGTPDGPALLANFLSLCRGDPGA